MQADFVTLLLWFFLAANPNLAQHNAWYYSVVIPHVSDRTVHVVVHETNNPNSFHVRLTSREQEVQAVVTRQINGYQVSYQKPDANKKEFVPFFPVAIGRPWQGDLKVTSIIHEQYPVWDADTRFGDVTSINLQGATPKDRYTVYTGEKVGLRRLLVPGLNLDYSCSDVYYQKSPWDTVEGEAFHKDPSR